MTHPERDPSPAVDAVARDQAPRPRALDRRHFRKVADRGFGDPANSYAYCYAWFDGHVYIGTNRHALAVIKKRSGYSVPFAAYPVPVPDSDDELDLRGQIWRHEPGSGVWDRVYLAPMTRGREGREVPVALGFRNMAVFQGRGDDRPAIYTIGSSGTFGAGPVLLRSGDGRGFEVCGEPGLGLGAPDVSTFRGVVPFRGRLFATPAGSRGGKVNISYKAVIYCSDDPARGGWAASNPPSFGDPTNVGVFDIGVAGDYLYAGTANVRRGCQLWRTDAEGPPPHRWERVFDDGAGRGPLNQLVMSFAALGDTLYLGTGIQNGGHDRYDDIGPAAGEVLRVEPDGSWDLVVGEPRMTARGLLVPSSGLRPGFDNPMAGYIWRMVEHEGVLYVGTFDSHTFLSFADGRAWPDWARRRLDPATLEGLVGRRGGGELWASADGDRWAPVTRNGFGNRFNYGFRALLSTPEGLFAGTANPFGPRVAVRGPGGWRYEDNPSGGVEVWQGRVDHDGLTPPDDPGPAAAPVEGRYDARSIRAGRVALWDESPWKDVAREDGDGDGAPDPDAPEPTVGDELTAYFGGPARDVGYRVGPGVSPRRASARLVEELLALLPDAGGGEAPAVLAIAAGPGGAAGVIRRLRPSARLTALDPGKALRRRGPFGLGGAPRVTRLRAPDAAFDAVLWVEGPSAIDRPSALREVRRVLKPGGRLVAADLIAAKPAEGGADVPAAGAPGPPEIYLRDLAAAGLVDALALDVTRPTWLAFFRHSRRFFGAKRRLGRFGRKRHRAVLDALPGGAVAVSAYLLVAASRPR